MKFTLAFLSGLMATSVVGMAIPAPQPEPEALAEPVTMPDVTSSLSDAAIIETAASGWLQDANIVSGFLDGIYNKRFKSQALYLKAAQAALAAEEAEWALKETLADYLLNNPACQAANSTLSDGDTWGNVKDLLEQLTELDWIADQTQIQQILNEINFGDGSAASRCSAILPAFDAYFNAANKELISDGALPIKNLRAKTPKSCSAGTKRDVLEG